MRKQGQSLMEYSILIIILLGVFLAMNTYVKRGIQGRWKASVDGMGDQYDQRTVNSVVNYTTISNTSSDIRLVQDATSGKEWTQRTDTTDTTENKTENTTVGNATP